MSSDSITMRCPHCQAALRVPATFAGKTGRCRKCQSQFQITAGNSQAATVPAPQPAKIPQPQAVNKVAAPAPQPPKATPPSPPPVTSIPAPAITTQPSKAAGPIKAKRKSTVPQSAWVVLGCMTVLALGSGGYAAYLFNPSLAAVAHHEATESADIEATDAKGGKNAAKGKEAAPAAAKGAFPRRALFIAVNNYLFNNPVQQGPGNSWKGLDKLKRSFEVNLRIPSSQALQLTDAVPGSQPPTKSVIEKTVAEFTKSSRSQDCIVVWFTGHAVMAGDKACLVPIEGELDNAASLVPLETIYKDLKECKARQKVLVLDVCHYSPSVGQERPGSDPLSEALEKQAKAAPEGVQVWLPCQKDQNSFETDEDPMGVFAAAVNDVVAQQVPANEQRDHAIDIERINSLVNKGMAVANKPPIPGLKDRLEAAKRDGKQAVMVSAVFGKGPTSVGAVDPEEPMPDKVQAAAATKPDPASVALMNEVFKEISTPPIKQGHEDRALRVELLPPIPNEIVKEYAIAAEGEDTELRKAVRNARVNLWAVSNSEPPADIKAKVLEARGRNKKSLDALVDYYGKPAEENRFKADVLKNQQDVAGVYLVLEEDLENLTTDEMKKESLKETKRWQANYRYMISRIESQIAYILEYQTVLGSIRKEFPPLEKNHNGWRLASSVKLRGDRKGQQLAKSAGTGFEKLGKETAGRPWAILAKRDRLTALGLEWQSSAGRKE